MGQMTIEPTLTTVKKCSGDSTTHVAQRVKIPEEIRNKKYRGLRISIAYYSMPRTSRWERPEPLQPLEERVGLSNGQLGKYMRDITGARPSPETVEKIAAAMRTSTGWILYGDGEAPRPTGLLWPRDVPDRMTPPRGLSTPMEFEEWLDYELNAPILRNMLPNLEMAVVDGMYQRRAVDAAAAAQFALSENSVSDWHQFLRSVPNPTSHPQKKSGEYPILAKRNAPVVYKRAG